jgi:hypothetical protein
MSAGAVAGAGRDSRGPSVALIAVLGVALLLAALSFSAWTVSSGWAFPWFVVVVWVVLYAPGRVLLRLTRLPMGHLDGVLLSLLLGLLAALGVFWLCGRIGPRELFWLWPAGGVAIWLRHRVAHGMARPAVRWSHVGLAVTTLLSVVPLAIVPIYYRNLVPLPDGGLSYQELPDVVFHVGIARELEHSIPPQIPFLPGAPLNYHYAMDLLVALLASVPGLDVADLSLRFVPTLLTALLALVAFAFGRTWLRSESGAALFALLVFFGEDLSYLPGAVLGSTEAWPVAFFGVPTIVSLYLLNPMVPALALLFGGLTCLLRSDAERSRAWLVMAGVLFAGLVVFKVFAAAQLLASLGIAAVAHLVVRRDRRPALVLLLTGLFMLPLAWSMAAAGVSRLWVRPDTWPWVPAAVIHVGLAGTAFGREVFAYLEGSPRLQPALVYWLIALPAYLLGALGGRWLGLPEWLRECVAVRPGGAARLTVAVFVGLGPLLAFTWVITPAGYEPLRTYNEAVWFFVQAKYVAWLFAVGVLLRVTAARGTAARALAFALLLLLAVPSSVQYLVYQLRNTEPRALSADQVQMLQALEARSTPGDVVVAPPSLSGAVVALTHCRAQWLSVFSWAAISREELQERQRREAEFWAAWRRGVLDRDRLRQEGARFILAEGGAAPAGLSPVEEQGTLRLYEIGVAWPTTAGEAGLATGRSRSGAEDHPSSGPHSNHSHWRQTGSPTAPRVRLISWTPASGTLITTTGRQEKRSMSQS